MADRVTGVVQNGSLPFYSGVILLTATLAPGIALLTSAAWGGWPVMVDAPAHLPIAGLIVGAALGAAVVRRRLAAVVFLGVVGYGMTDLFVIEGAPDLALTQVTVETLSTVLFVLVLRVSRPDSDRREPWDAPSASSSRRGWDAWSSRLRCSPPATAPHLRCRRR